VANGWPERHMAHAITVNKGSDDRVNFVPLQILMLGPPLVPIWVAGWLGLFRRPEWRPIRAFGWAYLVVSVIVLVTGGQDYYTFGLLGLYYAVGCVRAERWVAGRGGRTAWLLAAVAVSVAVSLPIALPLVPVGTLGRTGIGDTNQAARDQVGWPVYTRQVAAVFHALPAADQARTAVITGNYGEAGALARFGPAAGLPAAVYSGQNQLYFYGPPPPGDAVALMVGFDDTTVFGDFASCVPSGTLDNGVGVDNEEQGRTIVVCRGPRAPWTTLWPSFQHYD
jgi:hypothetical protein